jgi:hypothetical protein
MKVRFLLLVLAACLLASAPARSQGCPPDGLPGDIVYNSEYGVFQGCTPFGWKAFHGMPASFFPASIAGLTLWLDASDTGTITASGGAVSQWRDKSGNGNHATQGTEARQFTTGSATINGLNVLSGDGDDTMVVAGLGTAILSGPNTFIGIVQSNDISRKNMIVYANDGTNIYRLQERNEVEIWWGHHPFARREDATNTTDATLYVFRRDGADAEIYKDGGPAPADAITAAVDVADEDIRISGYTSTGNEGYLGHYAELLFFSRALTDDELNQIGNYLAGK